MKVSFPPTKKLVYHLKTNTLEDHCIVSNQTVNHFPSHLTEMSLMKTKHFWMHLIKPDTANEEFLKHPQVFFWPLSWRWEACWQLRQLPHCVILYLWEISGGVTSPTKPVHKHTRTCVCSSTNRATGFSELILKNPWHDKKTLSAGTLSYSSLY